MAFASFVADAAIAVVQAAADEIGGPAAPELRRNASTLVYSVRQLAVDMDGAIGALTDIDKLESLAFSALDEYPPVVGDDAEPQPGAGESGSDYQLRPRARDGAVCRARRPRGIP